MAEKRKRLQKDEVEVVNAFARLMDRLDRFSIPDADKLEIKLVEIAKRLQPARTLIIFSRLLAEEDPRRLPKEIEDASKKSGKEKREPNSEDYLNVLNRVWSDALMRVGVLTARYKYLRRNPRGFDSNEEAQEALVGLGPDKKRPITSALRKSVRQEGYGARAGSRSGGYTTKES